MYLHDDLMFSLYGCQKETLVFFNFYILFEILMACNASRRCWETKRKIIIIELKINGKMKEIFFEYLMN